MTSIRMALSELLRISSGPVAKLAVLSLVLIPTLYGGLYLYANHDPYANLNQVPVALVSLDRGAQLPDGSHINAGARVERDLISSGTFQFSPVGRGAAVSGVRSGRYDFALTIPPAFSDALTPASGANPRQAKLRLITNDANGYLGTTIADRLVQTVRASLARQVGMRAAEEFLLGFTQLRADLASTTRGANRLAVAASKADRGAVGVAKGAAHLSRAEHRLVGTARLLKSGAGGVATAAGQVATATSGLSSSLSGLSTRLQALPTQASHLAQEAGQVATGTSQLGALTGQVSKASAQAVHQLATTRAAIEQQLKQDHLSAQQIAAVLATYDKLQSPVVAANQTIQSAQTQITSIVKGAGKVSAGTHQLATALSGTHVGAAAAATAAGKLNPAAQQLSSSTGRLAGAANTLARGQRRAAHQSAAIATGARKAGRAVAAVHDGMDRLDHGLRKSLRAIPTFGHRQATASTIGDPVTVTRVTQARATSYGAGLAPFFMALAAWIGGYVLFLLVRPLSRRALAADQNALRVALAGWYTPALLGIAQMVVLFGVIWLGLRIVPAHPLATAGFLLLISFTFIAIVHTLNAWFGPAGEFIGLVLLVLQLVSSGGTFPWQTLPAPLQLLHDILPMSYAVDGLRHLMYGGNLSVLGLDVGVLLAYLVAALWLSAAAARNQRVWTTARIKPRLIL